MGLDVSTYLIVGVPLVNLGEIEEEIEHIQMMSPLGKPTGQQAKIRRIYLSTNNHRYLIGSNEETIGSQYGNSRIDFFFDQMLSEEESEWLFRGGNDDQTGTVIGKPIKSMIKNPDEYARLQQFSASSLEQIQDAMPQVAKFLLDRFDYKGTLFIFAFASYSY